MPCCRIQPTDHPELIELIGRILRGTGAHNAGRFDGEQWRWRYTSLPSAEARVYGYRDGRELKGYYHAPVYEGMLGGRAARYAVVQDVAIDAAYRGRGCFRELAEYATADLAGSDIDLIYTFPNARSIRTFTKYTGYRAVTALPTYVLPLRSAGLLAGRLGRGALERRTGAAMDMALGLLPGLRHRGGPVRRVALDAAEVGAVYEAFEPQARFRIARTPEYLAWRFNERLAGEAYVFAAGGEGAPKAGGVPRSDDEVAEAVTIFRIDTIFGASALLLMDFAHRPGKEASLLRLILDVARSSEARLGRAVDLVFASGQARFLSSLPGAGFIPVPAWANPRPLNLLARGARRQPGATLFEPDFWHITLADWDVF